MALLHLIAVQYSYDIALMIHQDSVDARFMDSGKFWNRIVRICELRESGEWFWLASSFVFRRLRV